MYHLFLPLISFLIAYKFYDITFASGAMCGIATILIAVDLMLGRKVKKAIVFSTSIASLVFVTSLIFQEENLLKMRPTIIYSLFAAALVVSNMRGGSHVYDMLDGKLSEKVCRILSNRWAGLFIFIAVLNEWVWRTFPEPSWVTFKTAGIFAINTVFALTQLPLVIGDGYIKKSKEVSRHHVHSELSKD